MRRTLHDLGCGYRSGDKGDIANVAVFAPDEAVYRLLVEQVTAARVQGHFGSFVRGPVQRYEAANVLALNFVLHGALGGGGPRSLRADTSARHSAAPSFASSSTRRRSSIATTRRPLTLGGRVRCSKACPPQRWTARPHDHRARRAGACVDGYGGQDPVTARPASSRLND